MTGLEAVGVFEALLLLAVYACAYLAAGFGLAWFLEATENSYRGDLELGGVVMFWPFVLFVGAAGVLGGGLAWVGIRLGRAARGLLERLGRAAREG